MRPTALAAGIVLICVGSMASCAETAPDAAATASAAPMVEQAICLGWMRRI